MRSVRYAITLILSFLSLTLCSQNPECGTHRTQTQGGWGTSAAGNNPGSYRDAHFYQAFPQGIVLGCEHTLEFTSSAAVEQFLPSGGSPAALTTSHIDPESLNNVLAGQVLALTLSVGFDLYDPTFSDSEYALEELLITSGEYEGMSVQEILQVANEVLGACSSNTSPSSINSVISSINQNFVDGTTDNGFLTCPPEIEEEVYCSLELIASETHCAQDDSSYSLNLTFTGTNGQFILQSDVAIADNEQSFCLGAANDSSSLPQVTLTLDFPQGVDYSFEVLQVEDETCAPNSVNSCAIPYTQGSAPDCCNLDIQCNNSDYPTFTCTSEIPDPDSSLVEIISACGPISYVFSENREGSGCYNDPMMVTHSITVTSGTEMAQCHQEYRVVDSLPPDITCPPTLIIDCSNNDTSPTEWATAEDQCDSDPEVSYTDLPYSGCNGFNRMWTALDACGNMAVCYQEVLFQDTTPPVLNVPSDIEIECSIDPVPQLTGMATAYDLCGNVQVTFSDTEETSGTCDRILIRTWTATDACGNVTNGQQQIIRTDLTGPTIYNVPPSTTIQCDSIPEPTDAYAVDACSGDTLEVSLEVQITENGCRTTVQHLYTAFDSCDNSSSRTRTIIIEDTQAPTLTCPTDVTLDCGATEYGPDQTGYPEAMDNCSGSFVAISYLDSELNMNSCPPMISRQWTAIDTCGNTSNCIQRIYFQDTTPPTVECMEDAVVDCSLGQSTDPEFTGYPSANDDCSTVTISYNDGELSGDCPISFTRTWIIQDACYNAAFCQQTITILDEQAPELLCDDVSISCAYSNADPSVTGQPVVLDCNTTDLTYTDSPLTGECPKVFQRTWTATDICGNSSTCTQQIALEDNMIPVIFCPSDTLVDCMSDVSPEILGEATAIDFCSTVSVAYTDEYQEQDCGVLLVRQWHATDACGNSRVCLQLITLQSPGISLIECPSDTTVGCGVSIDPVFLGYPRVESACSSLEIYYSDSTVNSVSTTQVIECDQLRTQTQGGWGTSASGDNPGTYRDKHFAEAFPQGLTIGCDHTIEFTSSQAVETFLPSGSHARPLQSTMIDPSGYKNVLAGQVLALSLSVGFDRYDDSFGESEVALEDMYIGSGPLADHTVAEALQLANEVLGGCENGFSASTMNDVISKINENYVDGTGDGGFLVCPEEGIDHGTCSVTYRSWYMTDQCSDTLECLQVITESGSDPGLLPQEVSGLDTYPVPASDYIYVDIPMNASTGDLIEIRDIEGHLIRTMTYSRTNSPLVLDLNGLNSGVYFLHWYGTKDTNYSRFIKE